MSFIKILLKENRIAEDTCTNFISEKDKSIETKPSKNLSFEEILKANGIKVKNRILTDFGVQFELFKKPNIDEIEEMFTNKILFKGNYIFVLESEK